MTTRTAEEIIGSHYAAGRDGDLQRMFADFSPDITWKESAGSVYAGTFHGMAEVIPNIFERINADWENFGAVPEYMIADEQSGKVAVVATYVGTYRATGKAQNVRVVHLWTVDNGAITAFEQVVDSAAQFASMS